MLPAASSTTGAEYKHYEGRTTVYVLLTCLLAACGGLMFGYDIGISGMYNKQNHHLACSCKDLQLAVETVVVLLFFLDLASTTTPLKNTYVEQLVQQPLQENGVFLAQKAVAHDKNVICAILHSLVVAS